MNVLEDRIKVLEKALSVCLESAKLGKETMREGDYGYRGRDRKIFDLFCSIEVAAKTK